MNKYFSPFFLKIVGVFLIWRVFLTLVLLIAMALIPLASYDHYLGGGGVNYLLDPRLFSWANFDGEHYLSIAIYGYKFLEQAFFPVYPTMIAFLAKPFFVDLISAQVASIIIGLLISNISFLLLLIFLWKLIKFDFTSKIANLTIISLVLFPTSFYFASLYNESLFLLISVLTFYSARRNKWWLAGILGAVASSTRVFGILLFPALLIEAWQQKISFKKAIWISLIPFGLGLYMLYQYINFGDPIAFYHLQKIVGEQHQSGIILLPQVLFRYSKMILTVNTSNPIYQTIILEFITGIMFFILPIYGYFKKIRMSYLVFSMLGFLLPTIQGSFSSLPRYALILFPSFLALAIFLNNIPRPLRIMYFIISLSILGLESALFLRGYWVA